MSTEADVLPDLEYKPRLRLHLDDIGHTAITSFITLIDCNRLLPNAIKHVLDHLYTPFGLEAIPKVRSVTTVLRRMEGVAYTTGLTLDDLHKEIHVSLDYLGSKCDQPLLFRDEAIGVITHEMVHCFQNNCKGTAPGGLIEGIADYVRLKAGLAPPHWKRVKDRMGRKWDEGYQKTAWFLEWLEDHRGAGTVSRMNEKMGRCKYDEDTFWSGLFGESIDTLWKRYVESWNEEKGVSSDGEEPGTEGHVGLEPEDKEVGSDTARAGSPIGTEPEIVDLSKDEQREAEESLKEAKAFQA